jgi:hypothetical protein
MPRIQELPIRYFCVAGATGVLCLEGEAWGWWAEQSLTALCPLRPPCTNKKRFCLWKVLCTTRVIHSRTRCEVGTLGFARLALCVPSTCPLLLHLGRERKRDLAVAIDVQSRHETEHENVLREEKRFCSLRKCLWVGYSVCAICTFIYFFETHSVRLGLWVLRLRSAVVYASTVQCMGCSVRRRGVQS